METILATALMCVLLAPCVISLSTYNVSLGSREGDHGNTVTATCTDASGTELLDPVWYFNGSEEHHCLRGAVRTNASVTVHIFPDCEGYLQCGTVETLSRSIPLYGNTVVCFSPPFTSFVLSICTYCVLCVCSISRASGESPLTTTASQDGLCQGRQFGYPRLQPQSVCSS